MYVPFFQNYFSFHFKYNSNGAFKFFPKSYLSFSLFNSLASIHLFLWISQRDPFLIFIWLAFLNFPSLIILSSIFKKFLSLYNPLSSPQSTCSLKDFLFFVAANLFFLFITLSIFTSFFLHLLPLFLLRFSVWLSYRFILGFSVIFQLVAFELGISFHKWRKFITYLHSLKGDISMFFYMTCMWIVIFKCFC